MGRFHRVGVCLGAVLGASACTVSPASVYQASLGASFGTGAAYSDFLAARFSTLTGDYQTAAHYFRRSMRDQPDDPQVLERAVVSAMLAGQSFEAAAAAREAAPEILARAPFSRLVLSADEAGRGELARASRRLAGVDPGPVNRDIAWAIRMAAEGESVRRSAAAPSTVALGDRALLRALIGVAGARHAIPEDISRLAQAASSRPWADQLAKAVSDRAGSGARAGPPLPSNQALAAAVFLLTGGETGFSPPELRVFYARLVLVLDEAFSPARLALADAYALAERNEEALFELSRIRPSDPEFALASVRRAALERKADRADAALSALRQVDWSKAPRDTGLQAADLYRQMLRYAEALTIYSEVLSRDETQGVADWRVRLARAEVLRRLEEWPAADRDWAEALRLAPDQPLVLNDVAYSWVERGRDLPAALELLKRAAELRPDDASILDSLAAAYAALGQMDAALEPLERAAELAPTRADIQDRLGDVYWRLGRRRDAEYEWRRALAFEPDAPLADRLRLKLASGPEGPASPIQAPATAGAP